MLRHIIPSRTRVKIFELFYHHPHDQYYLRKIVRDINEEVNAVKRELDILEKEKILLKERRLNKVFYTLNKQYILYDEFLRIFSKTDELPKTLLSNLPKLGKVKFIVMSSKFAKKQPIKDDDVYFLFVGTIVVPEVASIIGTIEKQLDIVINFTVMSEDEFVFRKKNNDPFLWKFLRQPKIMLVGQEEDLQK
ncbi:MAG: hypothetical protein AAB966_04335 [Patescibacteria group bacterium]